MRKVIHVRGKTISLVNKHLSKHNHMRGKIKGGDLLLTRPMIKTSNKLVRSKGGSIFTSKPVEKPIHKITSGKTSKPIRLAL